MDEYGEWSPTILDPLLYSNTFIRLGDPSRKVLRRRILQKILAGGSIRRSDGDDATMTTFTWVTAGDSAAAGHGTTRGVEQSYTAIVEDTVKDSFAALGIRFEAKNRAIGGGGVRRGGYGGGSSDTNDFRSSSSSCEFAMCMEALYGSDIDILNWDFLSSTSTTTTTTDNEVLRNSQIDQEQQDDRTNQVILWLQRAARHKSKPLLFMMDNAISTLSSHHAIRNYMNDLDANGVGVGLLTTASFYSDILKRIPDSARMSNPHDELPPALRYLRCNESMEGTTLHCDDDDSSASSSSKRIMCGDVEGEGGICKNHKWDTTDEEVCMDTRFQTDWHPGW